MLAAHLATLIADVIAFDPWAPEVWAPVGVVVAFVVWGGSLLIHRKRLAAADDDADDAEEGAATEARADVPAAASPVTSDEDASEKKLASRLSRTREALAGRLAALFGRGRVDEAALEELEELLIEADVGLPTAERLVATVRAAVSEAGGAGANPRDVLRAEVVTLLSAVHAPLQLPETRPAVVLIVGVNGSGKTTTIGKLAARFVREGKRVVVAAGDTYRAAAAEQLAVWADRAGAHIVKHKEGADPGAVVYDALEHALAKRADVVLVDTAGRLQTARPLMEQLTKVRRVIQKKVPEAPHETLLVLDGTMGQNAMSQARSFHEATPLTGVVITKLDGTARGGMVLAIAHELKLPVKFVGVGEQIDDLRDFHPSDYADAIV